METLYKCQYTGQVFNTAEDCEVHEYVEGGEQQKFYDLVNDFIDALEGKYPNCKVYRDTLSVSDYKVFLYRDRIEHDRRVKFDFIMDEKKEEYRRYSDEVGDWRWDWNIEDSVNSFMLDFEKEFVYPQQKVFEGDFKIKWDDYYGMKGELNGLDSDYLFKLMDGKKVKIEILENTKEEKR